MANSAFEDPAQTAKVLPAAEPVKPAAAPAATPVAAPPAAAATTQPTAPGAAAALFPHYADPPAAAAATAPAPAGLQPHKVKTQTIHPDSKPMLDDLASASGLPAKDLPMARTTEQNLIDEGARAGVTNMNQYAYELATTKRESRMGNTMNEGGGDAYFERNYGYKTHHRVDLENTKPGDGAKYKGRGLVQTTGFKNYNDFTHKFADENFQHDGKPIDLVNHPELATDPAIAARMGVEGMRDGSFTGRKLGDYVNDNKTDFVNARRVINGTDHAQEIADQATSFQGVLKHHAGDYADAVLGAQMKGLPSAQAGELSGNPAATPDATMFDPKKMSSGAESFVSPEKLLKNNLGRFDPTQHNSGKITDVKTHPVR